MSVANFDQAASKYLTRNGDACHRNIALDDLRYAAREFAKTCYGPRQSHEIQYYTTSQSHGVCQLNFPIFIERETGALPVDICECLIAAGCISAELSRQNSPTNYTLTACLKTSSLDEFTIVVQKAQELANTRQGKGFKIGAVANSNLALAL